MTGRMPEYMSDEMSENMSDRMPDRLPDRMPGGMSGYMPDRMPEYMPEYMSDRMSEYTKYMSKYTSWHVMVGITRSRVIFFLPLSKSFAFHPSSPALPSASAAQRSEVLTLEVKLLGARELHGLAEVEILTDVLHDLQHLLADWYDFWVKSYEKSCGIYKGWPSTLRFTGGTGFWPTIWFLGKWWEHLRSPNGWMSIWGNDGNSSKISWCITQFSPLKQRKNLAKL